MAVAPTPRRLPDSLPSLPPEDAAKLDALHAGWSALAPRNVGYPCNQAFDYSELFRFLQFAANNVGDPFAGSNYKLNSHEFEREVVAEFAAMAHAPENGWWGYVTNGGTEGNMYGLYVARELFPEGICYFSEDTHYSVAKILRLQHIRNIMIKSAPDGSMDCADLRETLRIHRDVPPIIFANIGTTMKGASDNLAEIRAIFDDLAIADGYIHADAALSGMILPFVGKPQPWNFEDGADSISISGHKLPGCPLPCGVVLARRKNVDRIARSIEYVGALDTTIAGSRNAITPLMLWYRLKSLGRGGLAGIVRRSLQLADYAIARLKAHGIEAWRHENSITVVFPRPPDALMKKWIIAPKKDIGHIITLPHVTEAVIDAFAADFAEALKPQARANP